MILNQISARHNLINRCSRETDSVGSYNSVFVVLFTLQFGQGDKSGSIKVVQYEHNEPGHGDDICDMTGHNPYLTLLYVFPKTDVTSVNFIRECW